MPISKENYFKKWFFTEVCRNHPQVPPLKVRGAGGVMKPWVPTAVITLPNPPLSSGREIEREEEREKLHMMPVSGAPITDFREEPKKLSTALDGGEIYCYDHLGYS